MVANETKQKYADSTYVHPSINEYIGTARQIMIVEHMSKQANTEYTLGFQFSGSSSEPPSLSFDRVIIFLTYSSRRKYARKVMARSRNKLKKSIPLAQPKRP